MQDGNYSDEISSFNCGDEQRVAGNTAPNRLVSRQTQPSTAPYSRVYHKLDRTKLCNSRIAPQKSHSPSQVNLCDNKRNLVKRLGDTTTLDRHLH